MVKQATIALAIIANIPLGCLEVSRRSGCGHFNLNFQHVNRITYLRSS